MDPSSAIGVASSILGGDGRPLVEPGAFFVTGEDNLRINTWNALAGVVLTISVRFLNTRGEIVPYVYTHTPNTNRTKATSDFPLGIGFPLNVQIIASSGAPILGQTYAQVQIIRGLGGNTTTLATLLSNYVTSTQTIAWPGSPVVSSLEGAGALRSITGAVPAAGAEISETVPTGARWELLTFKFIMTCSVAVANRVPNLTVDDGALIFGTVPSYSTLVASAASTISYEPGASAAINANSSFVASPLPIGLKLAAGFRIRTNSNGIQAADQFSAVQYLVREWIEG